MKAKTLNPVQAAALVTISTIATNARNGVKLTARHRPVTADEFASAQLEAIAQELLTISDLALRLALQTGWDIRQTSPGVLSLVDPDKGVHQSLEFGGAVGEGALPDPTGIVAEMVGTLERIGNRKPSTEAVIDQANRNYQKKTAQKSQRKTVTTQKKPVTRKPSK